MLARLLSDSGDEEAWYDVAGKAAEGDAVGIVLGLNPVIGSPISFVATRSNSRPAFTTLTTPSRAVR